MNLTGVTKILKFGGTSVGTPSIIKKVSEIISLLFQKETENEIISFAVVLSAFGGTTDKLLGLCNAASQGDSQWEQIFSIIRDRHLKAIEELFPVPEYEENRRKVTVGVENLLKELERIIQGIFLLREASLRTRDLVMSFGERLSSFIVSEVFRTKVSCPVEFLDSRKLIKTDSTFSNASVDFPLTYQNILNHFKNEPKSLKVITGFIGSDSKNETTTLGRGGSDYSASIFGAALEVNEIQIWTDVDGILSADPRKVPEAVQIVSLSYEEAMEMSYFGAKVLQLSTMGPALAKNVPISIKNTFNPEGNGTLIVRTPEASSAIIRGITSMDNVSLLTLCGCGMVGVVGISERLFKALASEGVNVTLISQASSEHSICAAIDPQKSKIAQEAVEKEFELEILKKQVDQVIVENGLSIVAVVGERMRRRPGIAGKIFSVLGGENIDVIAIAQGSSEKNISLVVDQSDSAKAVRAIHEVFFNYDQLKVNLFLAGVGGIGSELLDQIEKRRESLQVEQSIRLRVVGLSSSKKMLINSNGIDLKNWKQQLESGEASSLNQFLDKMNELQLGNSVFVDCTSSETVSEAYESILRAGKHLVTANKKANSSSMDYYKSMRLAARSNRVQFKYEANVGAGLPVISTLQNLVRSGDRIKKIEAILSGTLSFVFNNFPQKPFSQVVMEAKNLGLTEPDPRDDLNGMDVARKALILLREAGAELEMEDISVQSLVPESCKSATTVPEFFEKLVKEDSSFEEKAKKAKESSKVLKYIASLRFEGEKAKASVALEEVDQNHPTATVTGRDNIIVFTTERYNQTPLVVKGPGAGAAVTAAGVFADVLSIFS
eukprot:TRINITY_DN6063_c0_g1_i1.p1 TRINITY_DN6063_c0_g1~~TRINITY_DN6063_c0_g1_i1.p1  ORF type:complete len:856 (+),score=357.41 TRINITY_DN6063_c0_g1_i1:66-2570(+)